jgi:hypothetical protein
MAGGRHRPGAPHAQASSGPLEEASRFTWAVSAPTCSCRGTVSLRDVDAVGVPRQVDVMPCRGRSIPGLVGPVRDRRQGGPGFERQDGADPPSGLRGEQAFGDKCDHLVSFGAPPKSGRGGEEARQCKKNHRGRAQKSRCVRLESCASSLSPIAAPRPSSGPSTERREPPPSGLPRRRVRSYVRLRVWRQRSSIRRFRP